MTDSRSKQLYSHPAITTDPDAPIANSGICQWMNQWYVGGIPYKTPIEVVYGFLLANTNFDPALHKLAENDLTNLHLCVNLWFQLRPWFAPQRVNDLFQKPHPSPNNLGHGFISVTTASQQLRTMLKVAGWLYADDLSNDNTYLQIQDGKLYVKAQYILASRYLCDIKEKT